MYSTTDDGSRRGSVNEFGEALQDSGGRPGTHAKSRSSSYGTAARPMLRKSPLSTFGSDDGRGEAYEGHGRVEMLDTPKKTKPPSAWTMAGGDGSRSRQSSTGSLPRSDARNGGAITRLDEGGSLYDSHGEEAMDRGVYRKRALSLVLGVNFGMASLHEAFFLGSLSLFFFSSFSSHVPA